MVLSIVMVGVIAGVSLVVVREDQENVRLQEARAAAWHFTKVAKAARIYVRNNSITPVDWDRDGTVDRIDGGNIDLDGDNVAEIIGDGDGVWDDTFSRAALLADPDNIIPIPLAALIDDADPIPGDAGLLPPTFPATNIYGQNVMIFAAFYPLGPVTPASVPAAYVFLTPGPNPRPANMALLAQEAEKFGGSFKAPIFNNLGANVSDDCDVDGQPNVVSWGGVNCAGATNSIDTGDFAAIAAAGAGPFTAGALFAPAWRMALHDDRAVMRFSQQDNVNANIMGANLRFGEEQMGAGGCVVEEVLIPDAMGFETHNGNLFRRENSAANLCAVQDDAPGGLDQMNRDRRVNIENVANIGGITELILTNQGFGDVTYDDVGIDITPAEEVSIAGSPVNEVLTIGNIGTTAFGEFNSAADIHFTNRIGNPNPIGPSYIPTLSFRDDVGTLQPLQVDHRLELSNTTLSNLSISVSASATVDSVVSTQVINSNILEIDPANAAAFIDADGGSIANLQVKPTGTVDNGVIISNTLDVGGSVNSPVLTVNNDLTAQDMTITGTTLIGGNSVDTGILVARDDADFSNNVTVDGQIRVDGAGVSRVLGNTHMNRCFGNCPDIRE